MSESPDPNPDALTEYVAAHVTKRDLANIQRVMSTMGVGKAAAIRMLLRAGFRSGRWDAFDRGDEPGAGRG
jgi:hypothetical protein